MLYAPSRASTCFSRTLESSPGEYTRAGGSLAESAEPTVLSISPTSWRHEGLSGSGRNERRPGSLRLRPTHSLVLPLPFTSAAYISVVHRHQNDSCSLKIRRDSPPLSCISALFLPVLTLYGLADLEDMHEPLPSVLFVVYLLDTLHELCEVIFQHLLCEHVRRVDELTRCAPARFGERMDAHGEQHGLDERTPAGASDGRADRRGAAVGLAVAGARDPNTRGPSPVRAGGLRGGAPRPGGGPAARGGRRCTRYPKSSPGAGGRGRDHPARPDLAQVHLGRDRREVRARRGGH